MNSRDPLRDELLSALGPPVVRVEVVGGSGDAQPRDVSVWLGTTTDAERDALTADPRLCSVTREVVRRSGSAFRGVTVESQETVDRDYEGSWFHRTR